MAGIRAAAAQTCGLPVTSPAPNIEVVRQAALSLRRSQRLAAERIVAIGVSPPQPTSETLGYGTNGWLGPWWTGHGLGAAPPAFGFAVHEPHLVKMLAAQLNPSRVGPQAFQRVASFLAATFNAAGLQSPPPQPADLSNLRVLTEEPWRGRRLDLVFVWDDRDRRRAVVIEVKFGASVPGGTLPVYRRAASDLVEPNGTADLILIAPKRPAALNRNPDWWFASWRSLLRFWEAALGEAGDTDAAFAAARAALWRAALTS